MMYNRSASSQPKVVMCNIIFLFHSPFQVFILVFPFLVTLFLHNMSLNCYLLALEGASRPSPKLIVNMFSLCTSFNKTKIIRGFSRKISWIFKIFKNLMTIEFWWRQIFEILIFHKPSLGSLDVPQKIWARSVQPFWRLLDTNKQTDKPNL